MSAVNRVAGTPIASGDYIPVGIVSGDIGEIVAGTEYTEGATDATITGTAILWEDTSDTLRAVSAAKPLPVSFTGGGDASAANQTTEIGHLAGIETAITGTIDVTGEIDANLHVNGAASDDTNPVSVQQAALDGEVDSISPYALPANFVSGTTSAITDTSTTQVLAAPGASLHLYVTHILVQNSDATVGTWVILEEETSGTNLYSVYAPALGGGASLTLPVPLRVPTANKGLYAICETTSAEVRVSATGYKAP
jgi:hypothetical protein